MTRNKTNRLNAGSQQSAMFVLLPSSSPCTGQSSLRVIAGGSVKCDDGKSVRPDLGVSSVACLRFGPRIRFEMAKSLVLATVVVILVVFGADVLAQKRKAAREVDICIVIDEGAVRHSHLAQNEIFCKDVSCDVFEWVVDIAKALLQKQYDVRISVLQKFRTLMEFRSDPKEIAAKVHAKPWESFFDGNGNERDNIEKIAAMRRQYKINDGNRPYVPDMLVWIVWYILEQPDPNADLLRKWMKLPGGPEVVIGRASFHRSGPGHDRVTMVSKEPPGKVKHPSDVKEIATNILSLMKTCDVVETACYWGDPRRGACNYDELRVGQMEFCRTRNVTHTCKAGLTKCDETCKKGVKKAPCNAPCGGTGEHVIEYNNSMIYRFCPTDPQPCTGPPCPKTTGKTTTTTRKPWTIPTTTTTRTPGKTTRTTSTSKTGTTQTAAETTSSEKKPPLEPWELAVIAAAGVALLTIIVAVMVCCLRKRRGQRKHHGYPHRARQAPPMSRGRSPSRPSPPPVQAYHSRTPSPGPATWYSRSGRRPPPPSRR